MLKWNSAKLKDLPIQFIDGDRSYRYPKQEEFQDDGIAFLNSTAIVDNKLDFQKINFISVEKFNQLTKGKLQHNDIVMTTRGNGVGKLAYFNDPKFPTGFINAQMLIIRSDTNTFEQKFLFYLFISNEMQNKFWGFASGSAQPQLPIRDLREIEISYPELPFQRKIADVLSAYDDLIEVNTRRIRILEQMAQSVYREWFGKMGAQSLPEGWRIQTMQEVADVVDCLHTKKPSHIENGVGILLQLNNIGENGKLDLTEKFLLSKEDYELWTSRIEASQGDCVVTNVGRVAAVAQIPVGVKAALGRNMTGIRPRVITPTYLIEFLLSPNMKREVHKKKDSGVIMDALNVRGIVRLELVVPPQEVLQKFENIVRAMRRRIEILVQQNANLRRTRDLLLPRLVSGEVGLDELKIGGR